ncbi:uncharacterized protein LOC113862095 [Abrus precatorius]|uniref:Uncharacterized protein LOC113862095 n=1 Tax=Abrus precatorius TaxID=3816 RepID=A0A8B8L4C4_ABRPR|nr:uncharacterized protein LOC113862095 [Abrus precatorius]
MKDSEASKQGKNIDYVVEILYISSVSNFSWAYQCQWCLIICQWNVEILLPQLEELNHSFLFILDRVVTWLKDRPYMNTINPAWATWAPSSLPDKLAAIGLHFYPIWEAASVDEWLYNGGPYELIVLHFLLGVACYMGREWELSFRLGMRPWIVVAYSALIAAATAVFLIYPISQGSFSDGMPLGISGTFNFMINSHSLETDLLLFRLSLSGPGLFPAVEQLFPVVLLNFE